MLNKTIKREKKKLFYIFLSIYKKKEKLENFTKSKMQKKIINVRK